MSVKIQIILDEAEAARFKAQAAKESKSLSAWFREAGHRLLLERQNRLTLSDPASLKAFFKECNEREKGAEPDWEEHKRLISEGYQGGERP